MDISLHITDENCIKMLTKLKALYPNELDFTKQVELMLNVFGHFVNNSKWEFSDETTDKLEEKMQIQLREALSDNTSAIKMEMAEQLTFIEERISRPMQSEFEKFQDSIDQFRGSSKNASSKGKIGEKNIERQIEWYFPECEINDTRSEAEQADYHLILEDNTLLLEIKTYSKNVPGKEIDKFIRDLTTKTHINAGILISASSGIVKKPKFSYEIIASENGPKLAVYVPNAIDSVSGNCVSVVWAILFVLRVTQFQNQKAHSSIGGDIEEDPEELLNDACEMIKHQMSWLEYLVEQNQNSLLMMEKSYRKSINSLDEWIGECKKGWKAMDDILKQQIGLTRNYLNEGKKELIPLPNKNKSIEVSSANTWKCTECKKTYKTETNYDKHMALKHSPSSQTKLI
jgi:hypothetical protein